jgi:uncharacterized peroxidase-related enzyme
VLRAKYFDNEQIEAIICDYRNAGLAPAEVALMAFAGKVALHAYKITQQDIDEMRSHGFSDIEILDIIMVAAIRSFVTKVLDSVGWEPHLDFLKKIKSLLGVGLLEILMVGRRYSMPGEES